MLVLGLALHQATHSEALLDLFHAANHTVGIDTVRLNDTTIAENIIERFEKTVFMSQIIHASEAVNERYKRALVICRDAYVMLVLVHFVSTKVTEMWMISGTAKKRICYPIHTACNKCTQSDQLSCTNRM